MFCLMSSSIFVDLTAASHAHSLTAVESAQRVVCTRLALHVMHESPAQQHNRITLE